VVIEVSTFDLEQEEEAEVMEEVVVEALQVMVV